MATCSTGECESAHLPGTRRLHKTLHAHASWYRSWHHHRARPHFHLGVVLVCLVLAMAVVISPSTTGLRAELGAIPLAGRLTLPDSTAVADGTHDVVFRIYSVERGGIAEWTELHAGPQRITTINGYFTTSLGLATRLDALDLVSDTKFLGISFDGHPEMIPRWPLDRLPLTPFALE